ncbi:uncharacterized protein LOC115215452 isoform X2 [Octopus sinensis]|uniref:Uncharacterized protein LOC115215452 isoform X2 n=1 Tax=Octopus sinensis TaxID=2607531 RepID=A0A7E6F267_9MOLL|nr:uncharacterized protein LOC115215452 isoform X2 [Octopus sinensis]
MSHISRDYNSSSQSRSLVYCNIIPYVVSYIRLVGKDTTIKFADGIWLSSMATTGFGVSMLFTTYIEKVLGLKKTILLGSLIQSASTLVSYFTIRSKYYVFVITEGFCTGAGCAIPYVVTVSCAMKWLPHRKASAAGFVLFAHGMSAFIFNFVSTKFINPENYQENEFIDGEAYFNQKDLLARVPKCFLMLGGIFLISQLISVCLISNPKEEMNVIQEDIIKVDAAVVSGKDNEAFQDNEVAIRSKNRTKGFKTKNIQEDDKQEEMNKSSTAVASQEQRELDEDCYTPFQMLKTKQFYLLWLITFIVSIQYATITGVYKIYGLTFISDDYFLTILGSVCAIGNAMGRFTWGLICDKLLFKDSTILLSLTVSIFYLFLNVSSMVGRYFYFFIALLTYVIPGGIYVVMPYIISKCYGTKYYASNCGAVYTSLIASGLLNSFIVTGMQLSFGWYWTFFFFETLGFIAIILTVMFQKPKRPERRESELIASVNQIEP